MGKRKDYSEMSESELIDYCADNAGRWAAAFMQHMAKRNGDITEDDVFRWFANAIERSHYHRLTTRTEPNGPEAVYGFAAWLTTREQAVTFGAAHDASEPANLCAEFCEATLGEDIRVDIYPNNIKYPK